MTTWISQLGEYQTWIFQGDYKWIAYTRKIGPLKFMSYIAVALLIVSSGIPLLFVYGKRLRSLTSGKVKKARKGGSKWDN